MLRVRFIALAAAGLLATATIVLATEVGRDTSGALLPTDVEQSLIAYHTGAGDVVHFGFFEFPVAEGAPPVRIRDVELVGKAPGLEVAEVFSLDVRDGHRFVGTRARDGINDDDIGPLSAMVLRDAENFAESSDRMIVVGVRAYDLGVHDTEAVRVHYTSGGVAGVQEYDYEIGVEVVPEDKACDDKGNCPESPRGD